MTITRFAMLLTGLGVMGFLLICTTTLTAVLRRRATATSGVRPAARLVWTLVPAALLALVLGSLFLTGRMAL